MTEGKTSSKSLALDLTTFSHFGTNKEKMMAVLFLLFFMVSGFCFQLNI